MKYVTGENYELAHEYLSKRYSSIPTMLPLRRLADIIGARINKTPHSCNA